MRGVVGVENDGAIRDEYSVYGGRGNRVFKVAYYHNGANVSSTVTTGRQSTEALVQGDAPHLLQVVVRPNKRLLTKVTRVKGRRRVSFRPGRASLPVVSRSLVFRDISDSGLIRVRAIKGRR